jgi:myo-inositol 2-dehydrogenase / D-chiro-inositol 1-dehydrogenase
MIQVCREHKRKLITIFEEAFNQGYPQELRHFIQCVREDREPLVTGEDGRAVLELIYAAYHSARTGQRVPLPFNARVSKPVDLWHGTGILPA